MKQEKLEELFKKHKTNELEWTGVCHDCGAGCAITAQLTEDGMQIIGGAVYEVDINGENEIFLKCDSCFKRDTTLRDYMPCDVYSRVVGYLRPIRQWNDAKQQEHRLRTFFTISETIANGEVERNG